MRKLFILIALIACSLTSNASHLMGGDITAAWIGANASDLSYTITLSLYRDVNGVAALDSVANVTITDLNSNYPQSVINIVKNATLSTALIPNFPYGVQVGIYTANITLPGASNWRLGYVSCCRNAAIANITTPGSNGMTLYTDIDNTSSTGGFRNSTPVCLSLPIAYFPINASSTYNPLPYDVNGDSLHWFIDTPISANGMQVVTGFTAPPATAGGPFSMNPVTGEITWTPSTLGNFVQSFRINEYKAGMGYNTATIVRDMQYVIVADTLIDSLALVPVSLYNTNSSPSYKYAYYTPGQQLTFQLNGICSNASKALSLAAFGSIFSMSNPATFTTSGTFSNIPGTLTWTPPTGFNKDVIVVFRLHGGLFSKDFTLLLRNNPNPSNVASSAENSCAMNVYPNPLRNVLNLSIDPTREMNAQIDLYSVLGQKVLTVFSGKLSAGHQLLNREIRLAPGIYNLRMSAEGNILKSMNLIVQ